MVTYFMLTKVIIIFCMNKKSLRAFCFRAYFRTLYKKEGPESIISTKLRNFAKNFKYRKYFKYIIGFN